MIDFKRYSDPVIDIQMKFEYEEDEKTGMMEEIIFKTSGNYSFKLEALGDCCSRSFLILKNTDFILNKTIENIKEIDIPEDFELDDEEETSGFNNCTTPHLYEMTFKNTKETYKFMLYNYSNGYYDGWIEAKVI